MTKGIEVSETSGLSSYKQTVNYTDGIASSIWVENTNAGYPIQVEFIPNEFEQKEKEKESLEPQTV